ncbi:MAG: aldo/keto reductase [Aureisphaera sp.]
MKTLQFKNGDAFHAVGLGTWKATGDELKNALRDAIDSGYRHIDTAAVYGNEEEIGEVLKSVFEEGKLQREDLFITSKLWNDSHHPESVVPALQESLKKLQLDYLDLYLIHWPVAFQKGVSFPQGPEDYVPLEQLPSATTWESMESVKAQGLTKHIGVSNFSVKKLSELVANSKEKPEMNQVEMHPLLQQPTLVQYCKEHGIHLTAYSPLGSGDRADSMKASDEPSLFEIPAIKSIADKHGVHPAAVLINWHLTRDIAVIPKSTTKKNIISNFNSSELKLDASDLEQISGLDRNYRFINGKFFELPGSGYSNIYDE